MYKFLQGLIIALGVIIRAVAKWLLYIFGILLILMVLWLLGVTILYFKILSARGSKITGASLQSGEL